MSLSLGDKLGPYEILARIGAGGMGEVHRARDTRLERDVALKILPAHVSGDPVRRQRFEQEARAVAALNHPNIVAIYDVGEDHGLLYIVSELVDGEPLRGLKAGLRKTLDYAVQIASGLAAAHAAAIVHRDLKPDNIMLTRDGRIKILDFGLAKIAPARSPSGESETLTVQTDPGVVMGTVGYMSPEQVRGQQADHRSDIFSFGVILYELLGGERAFHGETAVETMTAILKHDPPELPDTVPSAVRQVVHHCLEKKPENRFQSALDLSFALSAISQAGSQSGLTPVLPDASAWRRRAIGLTAALALLAMAVAATRYFLPTAAAASWSGAILGGPEMALDPRLSPDGHLLAFQAIEQGQTQVAVMKPETGNWSILTHSRERGLIQDLAWSPDGGLIYYDRMTEVPQGIYSVPVLGGEEKLVLENAVYPETLPDGSLLVVKLNQERRTQLSRFWPDNGRLQTLPVLTNGLNSYTSVRAFPDGSEAVVFGTSLERSGETPRLIAVNVATGKTRPITDASRTDYQASAWTVARDGRSVLAAVQAGSMERIVSIPTSGRTTAQTLLTAANLIWYLDAAPDGSVFASLADRPAELVRRSPNGDRSEKIGSFSIFRGGPDLLAVLPDGRTVVTANIAGRNRLMAMEKGKAAVPLVTTVEETSAPMTVAGPHEIAFVIGPEPHQTIALAETNTGRVVNRISSNKGEIRSLASSPDGKTLYCATNGTVWAIPSTGGEPRKIRAGDSVTADPSGGYLVVGLNESSRFRLFRVSTTDGSEREIEPDGSIPLMGYTLSPNGLDAGGHLLLPLQPRESWFNAPGVLDTTSGRLTRLPSDDISDYHSMAWLPDGQMMALHVGLHSTLWRFQPIATARH